MHRFDIVLLSDFRFSGGTSAAVAEEIRAAHGAGYSVGLVALEAANLTTPLPLNPRLRALIEAGACTLVPPREPVEARLAQLHNPYAAVLLPWESVRVRAERRMVIVHHPPTDAEGVAYYDLDLSGQCRGDPERQRGLGAGGPAGSPAAGRARQPAVADQGGLAQRRRDRPVGRAARAADGRAGDDRPPQPARSAQMAGDARGDPPGLPGPSAPGGRILGRRALPAGVGRALPANWKVVRFGGEAPEQFLRSLDFFVYHHHPSWVEAFGCTIAEAMASGLPMLLPPHFAPLFHDGAIYTAPEEVTATVLRLADDPLAYRRQSDAAHDFAQRHFSHETHRRRLHALIGPPSVPRPAAAASGPLRVLLVSSNGVGMGHLTRLLAIARRLPAPVEPVFVTMSQAMHVVSTFGYLAEYLPFHQYLGCDAGRWNKFLAQELRELIGFYDARVVVFDSNCPFQGVIDAADACRQAWFVWCRRGMWQAGSGAKFLAREKHFDFVIEPRDLAELSMSA